MIPDSLVDEKSSIPKKPSIFYHSFAYILRWIDVTEVAVLTSAHMSDDGVISDNVYSGEMSCLKFTSEEPGEAS